jgi:Zn finger protein HypA/HybF involved in hydrogenase expression
MHEYAIVEEMTHKTIETLSKAGVTKGDVLALYFERGSTFSEDALQQAFQALSAGTILEGVQLHVKSINVPFHCSCGYSQVLSSDDLIGHMFVCPSCSRIHEIDESHDLSLIGVILKPEQAKST